MERKRRLEELDYFQCCYWRKTKRKDKTSLNPSSPIFLGALSSLKYMFSCSVLFTLVISSSADADVRWQNSVYRNSKDLSSNLGALVDRSGFSLSHNTFDQRFKRSSKDGLSDDRFLDFSFASEPNDVTIARGQRAYFDCQPTLRVLSADLKVEWRKDGSVLNTAGSGGRLSILTNGTLVISRIVGSRDQTDEGIYQCVAIVSHAEDTWTFVSRKARLQVAVLSRFEAHPEDKEAFVDDVVIFECRVDAIPRATVQWYKDNALIDSESDNRFAIHPQTGTLEIRNVMLSDRGSYKCKVNNPDKYRDSPVGRLRITKPEFLSDPNEPNFVIEPRGQVVKEGEIAVLACGANGFPKPQFQWLKDQRLIDIGADGRMKIVGQATLVIVKLKATDTGTYTCRASNSEDSKDASAALEIQVGPSFGIVPRNVVSKETTDINFECNATGNPGPSITWYKNGEIIIPSEYFVIDGPKLKVLGLVKTDQGVYQCMADNDAGSIQSSAQLIVDVADHNGTTTTTARPSPAAPPNQSSASEAPPDIGATDGTQPPPSEPLGLKVTNAKSRYVSLEWDPPLRSNGDLQSFAVFYKQEGSSRERVTKNIKDRQVTIDKLLPDTVYYFRVVAFNENGAGLSSQPLKVITQQEQAVPGKVRNLKGTAMSPTSIEVGWDPPIGDPVLSYRLFYLKTKGQSSKTDEDSDAEDDTETEIRVPTTRYVFHGLDKFSTYAFRVEAYGQNGPGLSSEVIYIQTVSDVPSSPPQDISLEAASSQIVTVSWRPPPENDRNGVITGYKIRYKERRRGSKSKTFVTDGSVRQHTISGLQPATPYVVRVGAITVNGTGPLSDWIRVDTAYRDKEEVQVPGPPTSLRVRAEANSITIQWTPPLDDGIMIRGYIVGWGVNVPDIHQKKIDPTRRYFTIKGLNPNRDYVISLRAYNVLGNGFPIYETVRTLDPTHNDFESDVQRGPPLEMPTGLRTRVLGSHGIHLGWVDKELPTNHLGGPQRPADGRHYTIKYTSAVSGGRYLFVNATETAYKIDQLKPNTQYEFSVKVVYGKRSSTWSMSIFNTTHSAAPTSAPRDLTAATGSDNNPLTVMLNWQPPKHANGPIKEYMIYYSTDPDDKNMQKWKLKDNIRGDTLTTNIYNLMPLTTYYFKIQARNDQGFGPLSEKVSYSTTKGKGANYGQPSVAGAGNTKSDKNDQSTTIIMIVIGSIAALACLLLIIVGLYCCRQKWSRRRAGYMAGKKSAALKTEVKPPPDLWINHQHDHNDMQNRGSPGSSMHDLKHTLYSQSPTGDTPRYHSLADGPMARSSYEAHRGGSSPVTERRIGRAKPMIVIPLRKQSGSSMAMSDVESGGGSLSRSYHQSSGSLDMVPPCSARQRPPQVVYTGPRNHQPARTTVEFGSNYGSGSLGLTPTPPPNLPNGGPPQAPPSIGADGSRTLPKRGTNPLKSFTVAAPPPPPPPPAPTASGLNSVGPTSPKTHVVRPVPITVVSSPHRAAVTGTSSVMAGGKPAGIVIGTKMATANMARGSPGPTPRPAVTSNGDLSGYASPKELDTELSHSYSTEELNVQMQNLDTMIDDLQAMQKEFNVV